MDPWVADALASARRAVLITTRPDGHPRPVPFTYAIVDDRIVGAVDHKAKSTTALARLEDIERTGEATVLVDHYDDDDWTALWWVRVRGAAGVIGGEDPAAVQARVALAAKYPQYRQRPLTGTAWWVRIDHVRAWRASRP
jgi:PPOX class probable F420-dependent enzyme